MKRLTWIVMMCIFISAAAAFAETVMLMPSQDGSIFAESTNSNGSGGEIPEGEFSQIFVGLTRRTNIRRGLAQFDLSNIPAGSTIDAATLMFTVSRVAGSGGDTTLSLHRLTASWGESSASAGQGSSQGSGDPASMGDATWQHRFFDDMNWANPGGDFVEEVSGSGMVGSSGSVVNVSGSGLAEDVAFWFANPESNHGWIMRGGEGVSQSVRSYIDPILTVEFSGGEMDGGMTGGETDGESPSIELALPGVALEFSVTLTAGAEPVDIYLGYITPSGSINSLIFEGNGLVESNGLQAILRSFVPVDIVAPALFTRPFSDDDPPGDYTLFAALAPAGDDPFQIDGLVSLSLQTITRVEETSDGLAAGDAASFSSGY